jgi:hypothetical protein
MDELAAPIRDRLALERQRLDSLMPEALDRAAEALALLRDDLRGEVAKLAVLLGRSPRYLRGELDGSHSLPLEDLFALASLRPDAARKVLERLAPEESAAPSVTVAQAGAELAGDGARFSADLLRDLEDGRLTLAETAQLGRDLDALSEHIREARAALLQGKGKP